MAKKPKYSEKKLTELILYVCRRCEGLRFFGATKLNKVLFFSDFRGFAELGRPITGADYIHLVNGPAPRRLLPVRAKLLEAGAADLHEATLPTGHREQRLVPRRPADLGLFQAREIAIVDDVIDWLRDMTGRQVSELSHEAPGWALTKEGESIPYGSVILPAAPEPLGEADLAWGKRVAARLEAGYYDAR